MKRKLFTFLVAFLATLSGAVWAQNYDYEVNLTEHEANNDAAYVVTENGSYRFYGTHNHGIQISRNISPTITLDGVTITVRGTAIEVNGDADPIIVLLGENVINSEGTDEAISVARDNNTSITFSENSTGSLTINMEDTESHYAIGEDGTCGDVIIKGGTIITEGKIGKLVDKNADPLRFQQHTGSAEHLPATEMYQFFYPSDVPEISPIKMTFRTEGYRSNGE